MSVTSPCRHIYTVRSQYFLYNILPCPAPTPFSCGGVTPHHIYIHIFMCIAVWLCFFFLFTVYSPAIMVPNAHSGGHPKCSPSYKYKNTYLYILYIWASSPHLLRWHHLEIHPYMFTDYRIIFSSAIIVLVPIPGPTAIEDGFRRNSVYVSMECPVRAFPSL